MTLHQEKRETALSRFSFSYVFCDIGIYQIKKSEPRSLSNASV